jgi:hypothetical protein
MSLESLLCFLERIWLSLKTSLLSSWRLWRSKISLRVLLEAKSVTYSLLYKTIARRKCELTSSIFVASPLRPWSPVFLWVFFFFNLDLNVTVRPLRNFRPTIHIEGASLCPSPRFHRLEGVYLLRRPRGCQVTGAQSPQQVVPRKA